jgi:hypothetical protein
MRIRAERVEGYIKILWPYASRVAQIRASRSAGNAGGG